MKYIPQSLEAASNWVSVCRRSLDIDQNEAASMYANMCGFGSWDLLLAHMVVERPSSLDEESQDEIVQSRHEFYRDVLVDTFLINPPFAEYLVSVASPSSSKNPELFSVDKRWIYANASAPTQIPGRLLNTFARDVLSQKLGKDFDFDDFTNRLRVHSNIFPGHWFNLMASLTWKVEKDSYCEQYTFGKPSMYLNSDGGLLPVYIVSLTRIPLDGSDDMGNLVLKQIEQDLCSKGFERAMLFWGSMLSKNIDGHWFTHPGMVYKDHSWHEFLINQNIVSADTVFEMVDSLDILNPDPGLEDFDMALNRGFGCLKLDVDCSSLVEFSQLTDVSGWLHILPTLRNG